jgi:hypothetical protein
MESIAGFKFQNGFSRRSCHFKRALPLVSAEIKRLRRSDLEALLREQLQDPNGSKTWATKVFSNVSPKRQRNGKDHFTILATMPSARTELPLTRLTSGNSERCESSRHRHGEIRWRDHTESGWTAEEIFIRYGRTSPSISPTSWRFRSSETFMLLTEHPMCTNSRET